MSVRVTVTTLPTDTELRREFYVHENVRPEFVELLIKQWCGTQDDDVPHEYEMENERIGEAKEQ